MCLHKIKIIQILVISVFFLSSGCVKQNSDIRDTNILAEYTHQLQKDILIKIPIDSTTVNTSSGITYHKGVIYYLNAKTNEIHRFQAETQDSKESIKLDVEGSNGVGPVSGFFVLNPDSLLIFPQAYNLIYLVNSYGKILQKYEYPIPDGYTTAYVLTNLYSLPLELDNGLLVKTLVDGNWATMSNNDLSSKSLTYVIDLANSQSTVLSSHSYPKDYWAVRRSDMAFSMSGSNGKVVYSFFADHNIYYSTSSSENLQSVSAKSKYISSEFAAIPVGGTRVEMFQYFATTPNYKNIIYDRYRNIYYRFCYPSIEQFEESELVKLRRYPKKFSIMILDEDLKTIGETLISNNTEFLPDNMFVGEDGLYISISHPDNPQNSDDFLSFQLFRLVN